jgi:drug/metabolite transporter (DMT)-like permease
MLGSVITAFLGWAIYGDKISTTRIIGFILLFVAVYIMSLYNKNLKGKMDKRSVITLVLGCVGVALSDFMQKVFVKQSLGAPSTFTFYTYALMIIPQLLVLTLFKTKKTSPLSESICDKRHVSIYLIISIALYLNVIMKTMAVAYIASTQLYPTLQGANLIASAICASIFFKEKITKKSIVGMSVALAAAILMNI